MKLAVIIIILNFTISVINAQNDTALAKEYNNTALSYQDKNEYGPALEFILKSVELKKEIYGSKSPEVASAYMNTGLILLDKGSYAPALEYFNNSLDIRKLLFGEMHADVASSYNNIALSYEYLGQYNKALENYFNSLSIRMKLFGNSNPDVAISCNNIGNIYTNKGVYDSSLIYHERGLKIRKDLYGEKDLLVAASFSNIGMTYYEKGDYGQAIEYGMKGLNIRLELLGEENLEVAKSFVNLGNIYEETGDFERSLDFEMKACRIRSAILGEMHPEVAATLINIGNIYFDKGDYYMAGETYKRGLNILGESQNNNHPDAALFNNNLGNVYWAKSEYDLALEYYLIALDLKKEIYGENNPALSSTLFNIGQVYSDKGVYDKALEYTLRSMKIDMAVTGEMTYDVLMSYNSIGSIYFYKKQYDSALLYQNRALEIGLDIFGEKHPDIARTWLNLGEVYFDKGDYQKAHEYFIRCINMFRELLGEKHSYMAFSYHTLGQSYEMQNDYPMALKYYHLAIAADLRGFNDTLNYKSLPVIKDPLETAMLLKNLGCKANMLYHLADYRLALDHYLLADSLISYMLKTITTKTDKIALGEASSQVYEGAIQTCLALAGTPEKRSQEKYNLLAFYFSEQNKGRALLEALTGQESLKFAGLPDSLLKGEHHLKVEIALFEKLVSSTEGDSVKEREHRDKLFRLNREYEQLILTFEKKFPDYFSLKYTTNNPTAGDIQKILPRGTALRSYFTGDSLIFIYTLTSGKLSVSSVKRMKNLEDSVRYFRYGLTLSSDRMKNYYRRLGAALYGQLFPDPMDQEIEKLIIIPDGILGTIPFEALLSSDVIRNPEDYSSYPFLIKKYNISYSYSANLFYRTNLRKNKGSVEITNLNDWLAFAPVFSGEKTGNSKMSDEFRKNLAQLDTDSMMVGRSMSHREYINPLPGTEDETQSIYNLYSRNKQKALLLLHDNASENFIKSEDISKYRIIHFATHGFVNSENPELSGILLSPDTTGSHDGILYSGELYNLKLNSDLVVLSACETGLGRISKGEGIIGLTRALLYAGTKNIIVSLWQVNDKSTSDLMKVFYKILLESNGHSNYSLALRKAKLDMIRGKYYAHPLFWSTFILIGN